MKIMKYLWVVSIFIFCAVNAFAKPPLPGDDGADFQSLSSFVSMPMDEEPDTKTSLLQQEQPSCWKNFTNCTTEWGTPTVRHAVGWVAVNGVIWGGGALASYLVGDWGIMLIAGVANIFANTAYCYCG